MFSRRTSWDLTANRLSAAIEERRRSGRPVLDLTVSNPTAVGVAYPSKEIADALSAVSCKPTFAPSGSAPPHDPPPPSGTALTLDRVSPPGSASPFDPTRIPGSALPLESTRPQGSPPLCKGDLHSGSVPDDDIGIRRAREDGPHRYRPHPLGDPRARAAIAASYAARGLAVAPEQIVLTASTSEAYSWLFKLLCDPGDRVLVPRPSYPLFEFLATLESIETAAYPLRYDGRWEVDLGALEELLGRDGESQTSRRSDAAASARSGTVPPTRPVEPGPRPGGRLDSTSSVRAPGAVRAIVVVNPNNPTGSYLVRSELARLDEIARERGLPVISDEVFATYPLDPPQGFAPTLIGSEDRPAFVLDGLSKSAGMPGMKLGWIVVQGPATLRDDALARLEMIADTYLSVGTPVQQAFPRLLEIGREVHAEISRRTRANLSALRAAVRGHPSVELLPVEGGWTAVLRLPATVSEEEWCVRLASEEGVLVQPGWFYDFDREITIVLSLLPGEAAFREGVARILARAAPGA